MNRRELLTSTLSAVAAAGVPGVTVETVDAEPLPLLLVLRHPKHLSFEARKHLKESFRQVFKDRPPCPIVVLEEGLTLQAVTDPLEAK